MTIVFLFGVVCCIVIVVLILRNITRDHALYEINDNKVYSVIGIPDDSNRKISMSLKFTKKKGAQTIMTIGNKPSQTENRNMFIIFIDTKNLNYFRESYVANRKTSTYFKNIEIMTSITDGEWHDMVVDINAQLKQVTVKLDDKTILLTDQNMPEYTTGGSVYFGSVSKGMQGFIRNVRVGDSDVKLE